MFILCKKKTKQKLTFCIFLLPTPDQTSPSLSQKDFSWVTIWPSLC